MGKNKQKQKIAWVFSQKRQQLTFPAEKIRASLIHAFYGNGKKLLIRERPPKTRRNKMHPILGNLQLESKLNGEDQFCDMHKKKLVI